MDYCVVQDYYVVDMTYYSVWFVGTWEECYDYLSCNSDMLDDDIEALEILSEDDYYDIFLKLKEVYGDSISWLLGIEDDS